MKGDEVATAGDDGIVQIMAATGGKQSYTVGENAAVASAAPAPNYLHLEADEQCLTITAYDESHGLIDMFKMSK